MQQSARLCSKTVAPYQVRPHEVEPVRPEYVSASCEVHRNHGPKGIHGYVVLEFERATVFSFSSLVSWPAGDSCDGVVEAAVREALRSIDAEHKYCCRLAGIRWHELDSCARGFAVAARHATLAAFDEVA